MYSQCVVLTRAYFVIRIWRNDRVNLSANYSQKEVGTGFDASLRPEEYVGNCRVKPGKKAVDFTACPQKLIPTGYSESTYTCRNVDICQLHVEVTPAKVKGHPCIEDIFHGPIYRIIRIISPWAISFHQLWTRSGLIIRTELIYEYITYTRTLSWRRGWGDKTSWAYNTYYMVHLLYT